MQALQALVAAEMEALSEQLCTLIQSDGRLLQEVKRPPYSMLVDPLNAQFLN